ncbi:MAG TPA: hypothetical protein VFX03_00170, partial [Thermomicrobiales bacterium]|nr:hypothetical protein [Thermomicrobiales bacterium]
MARRRDKPRCAKASTILTPFGWLTSLCRGPEAIVLGASKTRQQLMCCQITADTEAARFALYHSVDPARRRRAHWRSAAHVVSPLEVDRSMTQRSDTEQPAQFDRRSFLLALAGAAGAVAAPRLAAA